MKYSGDVAKQRFAGTMLLHVYWPWFSWCSENDLSDGVNIDFSCMTHRQKTIVNVFEFYFCAALLYLTFPPKYENHCEKRSEIGSNTLLVVFGLSWYVALREELGVVDEDPFFCHLPSLKEKLIIFWVWHCLPSFLDTYMTARICSYSFCWIPSVIIIKCPFHLE